MSTMEYKINKICRACLKEKNITKSLKNNSLRDLFTKFTNLEISEEDGLPFKLCTLCITRLNNSLSFQYLCIKNDGILKQQKHVNVEPTEDVAVNSPPPNVIDTSINNFLEVNYIEKPDKDSAMDEESVEINCELIEEAKMLSTKSNKKFRRLLKDKTTPDRTEVKPWDDYNLYLSCPKCRKQFMKSDRLQAHFREVHLGKKPEVCEICAGEFANPRSLRIHMVKHSGRRDFTCDECGKCFGTKSILRVHEKIHTGVRSFVCDVCGRSFNTNNILKAHAARKHSEERPFACNICPQKFKIPSMLKEHLLRHSGIKKFICTRCGHGTATKGELGRHMISHSEELPFACKSCPKRCKTAKLLTQHNKIHTGERPYQCDLCPMSFRLGAVLKNHRMTHTGEKPHVCSICGKAFTQRIALKTHMKIHK